MGLCADKRAGRGAGLSEIVPSDGARVAVARVGPTGDKYWGKRDFLSKPNSSHPLLPI